MSNFFKYLKVRLKRAVKVYPVIIVFTLVLALCAGILLTALLVKDSQSTEKQNLKIGIVGDIGDTFLDIGIETIQSFDSSRYYVTFVSAENEELAQKRLVSGEYAGYIIIPETFTDSLSSSDPDSLIYVSQNSPTAITPVLIKELVSIVSDFLLESQKGILGAEDVAHEYDVKIDMYDAHMRFINSVLAREDIYEIEEIGIGNGVGFSSYYIFAFIMILLLLWGISGCIFLIKKDMALPRLLRSRGYSSALQVLGDYIPFALMIGVNLVILTVVLSFAPSPEIYHGLADAIETPAAAFLTGIQLFPCALLMSAFQFLLYELCSNTISAVLSQLISCVALSFASGFFYPSSALPKALQEFSKILPTSVSFKYAVSVFSGDVTFSLVMILILYIGAFIALSALVREYKIRRSEV